MNGDPSSFHNLGFQILRMFVFVKGFRDDREFWGGMGEGSSGDSFEFWFLKQIFLNRRCFLPPLWPQPTVIPMRIHLSLIQIFISHRVDERGIPVIWVYFPPGSNIFSSFSADKPERLSTPGFARGYSHLAFSEPAFNMIPNLFPDPHAYINWLT